MIFISHRGNINGKNEVRENSPYYIMEALAMGFDVEIDVWYLNDKFFLGHDEPKYPIEVKFLMNEKFWCHAKNVEALLRMQNYDIHYFWHENDKITLTSKNHIWAYPTIDYPTFSIAVLPEIYNSEITNCNGICSDYVANYKENHDKVDNI